MLKLKSLLLFLLVILSLAARADSFIVTSKADNGAGTLREAITKAAANGTGTTDYITFNLSGSVFTDHAITLESELPPLTSNLVIDGSTQPGDAYGPTSAKVLVQADKQFNKLTLLKIDNASNVKVYGIYLFYGYSAGFPTMPNRSIYTYGISISHSFDIEIGAPGKGNVINGVAYGIYADTDTASSITIRSNYIGLGPYYNVTGNPVIRPEIRGTEINQTVLVNEECIRFINVTNITIGGTREEDGNVMSGNSQLSIYNLKATPNTYLNISHNYFRLWYDKTSTGPGYTWSRPDIQIGSTSSGTKNDYHFQFTDNISRGKMVVSGLSTPFAILRNTFDGVMEESERDKLYIDQCPGGGVIGDDDIQNANHFTSTSNLHSNQKYALNVSRSGPVSALKNSFSCNTMMYSTYSGNFPWDVLPMVTATTADMVTGTAYPGSRVDLYYDDFCSACEGEVYLATVYADGAGNWMYKGPITGTVLATETYNGYTSSFSTPRFDYSKIAVTDPTCGQANGSITGITTQGAESFFWLRLANNSRDTISKSIDLINVGPGQYALYAVHSTLNGGRCISYYTTNTLYDRSPKVESGYANITHPSCGQFTGTITGVYVVNGAPTVKSFWKNEAGDTVSPTSYVDRLPPGSYKYYAIDTLQGCRDSSILFTLTNRTGPTLKTAGLTIQPASCINTNDGSILNITTENVTGTPSVQWVNEAGTIVSSSLALQQVPGGKYRLKYKDQSTCDTIYTPWYTIPYQNNPVNVSALQYEKQNAFCGAANGYFRVLNFPNAANYTFQWIDSSATGYPVAGTTLHLTQVSKGNYYLIATSVTGCKQTVAHAVIDTLVQPRIRQQPVITNDICNGSTGSITGITVAPGTGQPPFQYQWQNAQQTAIATTQNLLKVPEGDYWLEVKDNNGCMAKAGPWQVKNTNKTFQAPVYANPLHIPKGSAATLETKNPQTGIYWLTAVGQALPLQQNNKGIFIIDNIEYDQQYTVQLKEGSCESLPATISIIAVDKTEVYMPTAFTPNNDGKNDVMRPTVRGYFTNARFTVYDRWGQTIFSTNDIIQGWNGKQNGVVCVPGTYVYTLSGYDIHKQPVRLNGTFVLMR